MRVNMIDSAWAGPRRVLGIDAWLAYRPDRAWSRKMTPIIPVIAVVAILLSGTTTKSSETKPADAKAAEAKPAEPAASGARVESESYTGPREVARCIAYNISKKMPELRVRQQSGESSDEHGYLILTTAEGSPTTFGVIRVDRNAAGTHLTTWLPDRSLTAAPEDIAHRLIAGC